VLTVRLHFKLHDVRPKTSGFSQKLEIWPALTVLAAHSIPAEFDVVIRRRWAERLHKRHLWTNRHAPSCAGWADNARLNGRQIICLLQSKERAFQKTVEGSLKPLFDSVGYP
jgi:hypothetical protein